MVFPQLPLEVMRYTWRFDPRLSTSWGFLLALQKILSHDQMVFPQLPLSSHSWKKPLHLHNVPHQQKYPVVLTSKTTYSILFHPEIFIKIFTIHTRNQIKNLSRNTNLFLLQLNVQFCKMFLRVVLTRLVETSFKKLFHFVTTVFSTHHQITIP